MRSEIPTAQRISKSGVSQSSDAAEMSNWTKAYMLLVAIKSLVTFSRAISAGMEVELMEVELMCVSNRAEVTRK